MNSARRGLRAAGLLVSSLLLTAVTHAQKENEISPWYFQFATGGIQVEETDVTDFDLGFLLSGLVGRRIVDGDRFDVGLEAEVVYSNANYEDIEGNLEVFGFFGNGTIDWRLYDKFGLYGSGGVGYLDVDGGSDDEQDIAYQFKAGVRYRLGEALWMGLGYRYWAFEEIDTADSSANLFEISVNWSSNKPRILR